MATAPDKRHHLKLTQSGDDRYPPPRERRANPLWLWFGVLGGPVAFGLVRLVGSLLVISQCGHSTAGSAHLGLTSAQQMMILVTIGAAIVAAAAGIASWRVWRQTRRQTEGESGESLSSAPFWALGGLFLSSVFFALILLTGGLAIGLATTCTSS
jgi:hypothetical protein